MSALGTERGWLFAPPLAVNFWKSPLLFLFSPGDGRAYTLRGRDGTIEWEFSSDNLGTRRTATRGSVPAETRWHTAGAALSGEQAIVMSAPPGGVPTNFNIGSGLAKIAWGFFLTAYGVDDTSGLISREVGSEEFRRKFAVFTREEETARRLLTPETERLALALQEQVALALINENGVTVRVLGDDMRHEPQRAERMAALGAALVQAIL